ncbi:MAG TPA: hypothetical protein VL360_08390 [Gammaproteobacteria bacterium]|nr:hypothetical protein [Gammaproteobacteria bacterium]
MSKTRMFSDKETKQGKELLTFLLRDDIPQNTKASHINHIIDCETKPAGGFDGRKVVLMSIDLINIRLQALADEMNVWKYHKESQNNQGIRYNFDTNSIEYEASTDFTEAAKIQIQKRELESAKLNAVKNTLSSALEEDEQLSSTPEYYA